MKKIRIKDLKIEEGAMELSSSKNMRPYIELFAASMKDEDTQHQLAKIAAMPLESRYTWRVISALKWAFADFDSECIRVDQATLSPEDLNKIHKDMDKRSHQFYLLLKTLFGPDKAKAMIAAASSERPGERAEFIP